MLCSIASVVAALAVTVIASPEPIEGATRGLPNTRMVRRSPVPGEKTSVTVKEHVNAKCNIGCGEGGYGFSQQAFSQVYSQTQFSQFSQLSYGSGFTNGVFPSLRSGLTFDNWSTGGSSLLVLANSMFGYASHLQSIQTSIQITSQTIISSFYNMVQSLSVCVQQFQGLGSFGGGSLFVGYYSRVIVAFQGLFVYISGSIGIQMFIQQCGGMWQQFISIFTSFISFGSQWSLFSGSFFQTYGINLQMFQSFGISTFQTYASSYAQSSSIAVGGFGGISGLNSFQGLSIANGFSGFSGSQSVSASSNSFATASSASASSTSAFASGGTQFGSLRN